MAMVQRKRWTGVAVFAVLAAVMGALQWNWFAMPLERDEGEYAYAAWLMRTGKGGPYRDSFLQKPPMIVYTYGLVEAIAPESDKVGFRVAGFLAALATAGLVWGLGKREFGGRAGMWSAWLWVAYLQQAMMFSSAAANVEKFMVVPMLGTMVLAGRGERRWWRWAAAGALVAAAVLYKPICLPVLGVYFAWTVSARQRTEGSSPASSGPVGICRPERILQRLVWVVLGGVVAAGAVVAWFAWKGAFGEMWECTVEYTGEYAKLKGHPLQNAVAWARAFGTWKLGAIGFLAVAGAVSHWRAAWPWACATGVAAWIAMTGVNGNYHVMALPFAAIMGGMALEGAARRFGRAGSFVACALLLSLVGTGLEWTALGFSPERLGGTLYPGNPFVEAEGAGRIVGQLCGEDETVHIVGSEPEILWYARRKGATRFDIAYPMALPTRFAEKYQREAVEGLGQRLPDAVVFVRTWSGFGGPPEVVGGYLRAMGKMTMGGAYELAWSYVADTGGWVAGGEWPAREKDGASMGIWRRVKTE